MMTITEFYRYFRNPGLLTAETVQPLKEIVASYPSFEAAWVLYLQNLKKLNLAEFENALRLASIHVQERGRLFQLLNTSTVEKPVIAGMDVPTGYQLESPAASDETSGESLGEIARSISRKTRLLDNFQLAREAIERSEIKKIREERAQNAESDDTEELVTETLARIYLNQGHYQKAIGVMEKLSLKYPEKNIYFAGQIEKIKKLLNN